MKPLNILIWHVHGSYLNTLAQVPHNWYVPYKPGRPAGYVGRGHTFDTPENLREVPAEEVKHLDLDLVVYQTPQNYAHDRFEILSPAQQTLPKLYLEHNVPRPHPTDSVHPVDDPDVLLVHVTHFNRLMWDNNRTPTTVIEHSVVIDPAITYSGYLSKGISVINSVQRRGRLVGYDLFLQARDRVPLDIAGMQTEEFGGLGDIPYRDLHRRVADYRFLFSPVRYTSLPLAVIEAMTIGLPVVALATTEVPSVIENGVHGYISCDIEELIERMQFLLTHPDEARRLGNNARRLAQQRFGLARFVQDWNNALAQVVGEVGRSV